MNAYIHDEEETYGMATGDIAELICVATGADIDDIVDWLESGDTDGYTVEFLIAEYQRR